MAIAVDAIIPICKTLVNSLENIVKQVNAEFARNYLLFERNSNAYEAHENCQSVCENVNRIADDCH